MKLQSGDPENVALWKKFSEVSLAAFQQIYDRLGIKFDHNLGESFYNDKVERVYRELEETKLAEDSEGALVVFHAEHPRFNRNVERPNPFMVRKADGASDYASTDLATALVSRGAFPRRRHRDRHGFPPGGSFRAAVPHGEKMVRGERPIACLNCTTYVSARSPEKTARR